MSSARIIITQDGKASIMIDDTSLTFEQAKAKLGAVIDYLNAQGIDVADITPVEQHNWDDDLLHELSHITQ